MANRLFECGEKWHVPFPARRIMVIKLVLEVFRWPYYSFYNRIVITSISIQTSYILNRIRK